MMILIHLDLQNILTYDVIYRPDTPSRNNSNESIDPSQKEELLDMIAGVQGHRMNEQRAAVPFLPGADSRKGSICKFQKIHILAIIWFWSHSY